MCSLKKFLKSHNIFYDDDDPILQFILGALENQDIDTDEKISIISDVWPELAEVSDPLRNVVECYSTDRIHANPRIIDPNNPPRLENISHDLIHEAYIETEIKSMEQDIPSLSSSIHDNSSIIICSKVSEVRKICEKYRIDHTSLDDDVINYIIGSLQNNDIASNSNEMENLNEVIVAYFPDSYNNTEFLTDIINCLNQTQQDDHCISEIETFVNVPETFSSNVMEMNSKIDSICNSTKKEYLNTNPTNEFSSNRFNIQELDKNTQENILFIKSITPHINEELIYYIYANKCLNNKLTTIDYILEYCSTEENIQKIQQKKDSEDKILYEKIQNDIKQEKLRKAAIFSKYGDKSIIPKFDERGKPLLPVYKPVVFIPAKDKKKQNIRFRDGSIVSYKGDKMVVLETNPADEYDGGSRGKVFTKGKRGKGFV